MRSTGIKSFLSQEKYRGLWQFVKFGLVGVSNTLLSYAIEMLCYYVLLRDVGFAGLSAWLTTLGLTVTGDAVKIILISALSFIISVTNSYFWNSRYVFKAGVRRTLREHLHAYFRTVLCYGVTGLLLAPAIKIWVTGLGVPFYLSSLASLLVTIPLNFLLNKYWAFKA